MKRKAVYLLIVGFGVALFVTLRGQNNFHHPEFKPHGSFEINAAYAYPPGVGILSSSKNCMSCHSSNGPWKDDQKLIIDVLDKDTKKSLKQPDGSFLIETKRWEQKTVLTVIGWVKENEKSGSVPYRNAWLYIDPSTIGTQSLSKFAPNWDVNLPMSCRVVGDKLPGYENADITSLPMTIQPLSNAKDAELQLQVMLTKGESVKGNAKEGMIGSYFERKIILKVTGD
jgi:hypothetical protein